MSTVVFVGPGSNNPHDSLVPENGQFSPAIGFAWQLPWFHESTTMRGGVQRTYGGAGSNFSGGIVSGYGGDSQAQGLILTDPKVANILATGRALNLTDLQTLIPTYPVRAPGVAIPIANRIEAPPADKGAALPVHPGALAFLNDDEQSFFDEHYGVWTGLSFEGYFRGSLFYGENQGLTILTVQKLAALPFEVAVDIVGGAVA
jgi:hypothetical protein